MFSVVSLWPHAQGGVLKLNDFEVFLLAHTHTDVQTAESHALFSRKRQDDAKVNNTTGTQFFIFLFYIFYFLPLLFGQPVSISTL